MQNFNILDIVIILRGWGHLLWRSNCKGRSLNSNLNNFALKNLLRHRQGEDKTIHLMSSLGSEFKVTRCMRER